MSQNVGQIDLGLGINQRSFNRQLNGIAGGAQRSVVSAFSGLGKAIGVTLGIAAIASFGKSCLKLGSDLSEVQNVVDVTFGDMAQDVNNFASTAIEQFGLSETAAKRYTGTMGAMLKSSGLTTAKALEMSKTITGLSADMASFYNLESEQAFEKIRSGISGETEPLKQLGINMSVANLEAYAMAEGISKVYSKMTQQEQTLLRYNYLLSVTKDAQGDFARTSDSWANQTRILAEQFNALKAAIGQGLIAAFTPIVKGLNIIIGKLRVAAGYFKAFMELIFGKQSSSGGSGMAQVAESTSNVVDSAGVASDAVEGVGDAAKKAGKKAKGALASFDELNQLSISNGSGSDSGTGGSGLADMGGAVDVDLGKVEEDADVLNGTFDKIIDKLDKVKNVFIKGFNIGIGGDYDKKLSDIKKSILGIGTSLKSIFTDNQVVNAFNNMIGAWILNAGKVIGSFVSIGTTICQNLLGGLNLYLEQNSQFIKDRLVGIFNIQTEWYNLWGNLFTSIADIFSVFGEQTGQQITANIIAVFVNATLGVIELFNKLGTDILSCIVNPLVNNKDAIKTAVEGALQVIQVSTETLKNLVTDTVNKMIEVYDQYIGPAFDKISNGIDIIVKALLDAFQTYIQPTLLEMAKSWDSFYEDSLKPVIEKAVEVFGKLVDGVAEIWEKTLAPFVAWAIDVLAPMWATAWQNINNAFKVVFENITGFVSGMIDIFSGLIDFIVGIFTGDWKRAWEGVKGIFKGIIDTFYAVAIAPIGRILTWVKDSFCRSWQTAWEGAGKVFKGVFDGLKNAAKTPLNFVIDMINKAIRGVNNMIKGINKVPGVNIGNIQEIPKLARGGVVSQPTLAMVGEAGKEAVVPLQNNTEWTGQVASLLASALLPFMQGNSGGDMNRDIVFNLGDVEFARAFLPTLIREADRQGVAIGGKNSRG